MDKFEHLATAAVLDVEHSIDSVLDSNTFSGVFQGLVDDMIKEEVEEGWSKDTALPDTIVDTERVGGLTVGLDSTSGIGV